MTDLVTLARQVALDHLAVESSRALRERQVPHAVIKGVTTARWLYDPPRAYCDVDLLVPASQVGSAVEALVEAGLVRPEHGRVGEEGPHSVVLVSTKGAEIDLHVTLPSLSAVASGDAVWQLLQPHLESMDLDGHDVPVLDVPARCVVLAMHVVASGYHSERVREDLRRARAVASGAEWAAALTLAEALGLAGHVAAAVALVENRAISRGPAEVRLRLGGAGASAIQLERLASARARDLPRIVLTELFPSRAFMERRFPELAAGRSSLPACYLHRLLHVVRTLPAAVHDLRLVRLQGQR